MSPSPAPVFPLHAQTDLDSGALFVQVCLGWDLEPSTVLMLVVVGLYTIAGRVLSVCWPQIVLLWLNHTIHTPAFTLLLLLFAPGRSLGIYTQWGSHSLLYPGSI